MKAGRLLHLKEDIKTGGRFVLTFFACFCLCAALLFLSALIPREAIRPQMLASAEYLNSYDEYLQLHPPLKSSTVDGKPGSKVRQGKKAGCCLKSSTVDRRERERE